MEGFTDYLIKSVFVCIIVRRNIVMIKNGHFEVFDGIKCICLCFRTLFASYNLVSIYVINYFKLTYVEKKIVSKTLY